MIDYEAVLRHPKVRGLSERTVETAREDESVLDDLITNHGTSVVTLGWDGGSAGNSGVNWITEWRGLYFFDSSDHDPEGPFDTLEEALSVEPFNLPGTPSPELSSTLLPLPRLFDIAKQVVIDGERVRINGHWFIRVGDAILPLARARVRPESKNP